MGYQKCYKPRIVKYQYAQLPPKFSYLEAYGEFFIYYVDHQYFAFEGDCVKIDANNDFILGIARTDIKKLKKHLDIILAERTMEFKAKLLQYVRSKKGSRKLTGARFYNVLTGEEYISKSDSVHTVGKQMGILGIQVNRLLRGDIVLHWVLI